jgi:hypothetical protein
MKPSKPLQKLPPHVVLAKRMLKISEQSTGETILQAALLAIKIVNKVHNTTPLTANPPVESNIPSTKNITSTSERQNHERTP